MKQTLLESSDQDMTMTFRFDSHGSSPRILRSKSILEFLPSLLVALFGSWPRSLVASGASGSIDHIDFHLELRVGTVGDTVGEGSLGGHSTRALILRFLRNTDNCGRGEFRAHQLVQSQAVSPVIGKRMYQSD